MEPVLLIVEDDDVIRKTLSEVFAKKGLKVLSADKGRDALEFVKAHKIDVTLLDLKLPDMNGLTILKNMHEVDDSIMAIVVTAYPEVKTAISAMKAGAYDYINKPFELEELKLLVDKALETKRLKSEVEILRREKGDECVFLQTVGSSYKFKAVMELVKTMAQTPKTSALIQGETGTGKELIANAIHCLSDRKGGPFIKLNCSAIPDNLLEAEMFGYEKGAFTDAKQSKKGLFELADGGTIFLDEIGDMDIKLQPKFLQVLENQTFRRVGGIRDMHVDVRVVAATNKNLASMVREKSFREDLYYRLKVMVIDIPPLRERREDVMPLAEYFIRLNSKSFGEGIKKLSTECRDILLKYSWPGNVRELKNIIERAMILAHTDRILPEHLPRELVDEISISVPSYHETNPVNTTLEEVEKAHVMRVVNSVKGNISQASRILGIARQHLRKKLQKYSLSS
ncbi:MAG: sigma-54-dependent Fis family transcriptional regulator [Deltaproteobacteria bacterium]|nr:sigma-54-dependent Fis family transcriptional regulator [Deltaproteobacteria bacterium]